MKTSEFIRKVAMGEQKKSRCVASVYFDGETLYSYGRHYPLMFKVGGEWLVNDSGYSRTTSKHIGQARLYSSYNMPLNRGDRRDALSLLESLNRTIKGLSERLGSLSKRAFRQKETIENRIAELEKTKLFLESEAVKDVAF